MAKTKTEMNKKQFTYYMIGGMAVYWSKIEFLIESYLKTYLIPTNIPDEIVDALGNDTRVELLFSAITSHETNRQFVSLCEHTKRVISVCRENRNFLSHGIIHTHGQKYLIIERLTRKTRSRSKYKIPYENLLEISEGIVYCIELLNYVILNSYAGKLSRGASRRDALPNIRALPRRIWEIPSPTP